MNFEALMRNFIINLMEVLEYGVLGLVQGLTEFLPVSSSGHLYLLQLAFGWESGLVLEVLLHVASLVAVVFAFHKKLWEMFRGLLLRDKNFVEAGNLALKLIVATLCTLPTALIIEKIFLYDLSLHVVAWSLIVTGGLIWISHQMTKKTTEQPNNLTVVQSFSWRLVVIVGLIQGIAVLPGISRSGLTIAALMMLGIQRRQSAEISFLLSIPTILGAFVFSFRDLESFPELTMPLVLALMVCGVVSWLTIRFMLQTIQKYWVAFVPYCLLLGIALLLC